MIKKTVLFSTVAFLFLAPMMAGTAWAESLSSSWIIDEQVKSRLFISHYDEKNNMLHMGWQVILKDGWKTYWRSPGDAGLPPRWDWKKAQNIESITVNWPAPEPLHIFDMDTYVYHHEVILPIDANIRAGKQPTSITLILDYMICEEICIPKVGHYEINISSVEDMKPSLFQKAQFGRYRAMVPVKIADGGITLRAEQGQLMIDVPKGYGKIDNIIIESADGQLLGRATPYGDGQFRVAHNSKKKLRGGQVTLTLIGIDGKAYEAIVAIQ